MKKIVCSQLPPSLILVDQEAFRLSPTNSSRFNFFLCLISSSEWESAWWGGEFLCFLFLHLEVFGTLKLY